MSRFTADTGALATASTNLAAATVDHVVGGLQASAVTAAEGATGFPTLERALADLMDRVNGTMKQLDQDMQQLAGAVGQSGILLGNVETSNSALITQAG